MIKKFSGIYTFYLGLTDLCTLLLALVLSYLIRFYFPFFPEPTEIPKLEEYSILLLFSIPAWLISFNVAGAYEPMRGKSLFHESVILLKALGLMSVLLTSFTFFYRDYTFSRLVILLFPFISALIVLSGRIAIRRYLAKLRTKGEFTKNVLIVGTGRLARELAKKFAEHPEMGLICKGFVSEKKDKIAEGEEVVGAIEEIDHLIDTLNIEQLYVATELEEYHSLEETFASLHHHTLDIKIVPDFMKFMRLNPGVDDLDGMPIINLLETPLIGWNLILKRAFDILFSLLFILISSPVMVLIAIAVKLTSKGPVFYCQERMGIDNKKIFMLKFRTMKVDAEEKSGAVWAKENDDRRTPIGAFLRSTSLDELPQFFNVLKGDMSIVGPRPERPVFVEQFKNSIPLYMLRHRMRAGITGWAQVHGLRGNTSLEKRVEFDLYYIEHWSLALDMKIIFMTLYKGFISKHAY